MSFYLAVRLAAVVLLLGVCLFVLLEALRQKLAGVTFSDLVRLPDLRPRTTRHFPLDLQLARLAPADVRGIIR